MPQYFGQRAGRVQTHTSVSTGSLDATQVNALLDVPVPNLEVNKVKADFTAWKDKYQARYWPFCRYILDRAESGLSDYLNKCEQKERNRQHLTRIHNFLVMSEEMQRDIWQMNLWKDRKRKFVWPVDDDAPDDNGEMDMEVDDVDFEDHHAATNDVAMGEEIGTAPLVVTQESAAANGQAYDEKRSEFDVEEYREQVSRVQKTELFRFLGIGAISGQKPLEAEVVNSPDSGSSRSTFLSSLREQLIRPAPLLTADWHGPDPNDRSISSTPPPLPEHYSLAQSQQSSANTISSPTSQEQEVVDGSNQMHVAVVSTGQQVKKSSKSSAKRLKTVEELEFDKEEYREQVSRVQKTELFRFLGRGAISGRKLLEAEVVNSPDSGSSRNTFLLSLRKQLICPAPLVTADWKGPDPNDRSISSTPPPLPEHYPLAQFQQRSANTISSPTSQEQEVVDGSNQMHVSVVSSRQQVKKFKRTTTKDPASRGVQANYQEHPEVDFSVDQAHSSLKRFGKPLEKQPTAKRFKNAEELEFDKEEYREQVSGFQKTALVRFLGGGAFEKRKPVEMERLQGVVSPENGSSRNTSTGGGTQNDRLALLRNQAIREQEEAEARVRAQRAADQVLMARILKREDLAVKRMTTVDKPNNINYFFKDRTRPPLFTADGRWNGPDPNASSTSSAPPPLQERYSLATFF
ncbi:unnamed protein product [Caenorhabditis brenneri]